MNKDFKKLNSDIFSKKEIKFIKMKKNNEKATMVQGAEVAKNERNVVEMTFNSSDVRILRNVNNEEDVLFCLRDVCNVLGLDNSQVMKRLDKGVVTIHPLMTAGGKQNLTFINEDGLYDVILDSRKPEAKAFRKWITSTVLPSIRKSGGYINNQENLSEEEIISHALQVANKIIERKSLEIAAKNEEIQQLEGKIVEKEEIIEDNKGKVIAYQQFIRNEDSISMTAAAKALGFPPHKFIRSLRECKYLNLNNLPAQKGIDSGYFSTKFVATFSGKNVQQAMITRKGLDYFQKKRDIIIDFMAKF